MGISPGLSVKMIVKCSIELTADAVYYSFLSVICLFISVNFSCMGLVRSNLCQYKSENYLFDSKQDYQILSCRKGDEPENVREEL